MYCSARTLEYYKENLGLFQKWVLEQFPDVELDAGKLTKEVYRGYLLFLRKKDVTNVTVNTYIRGVRVFLRWLHAEGYLEHDVTVNVKYPRSDASFVFPLTKTEAAAMDSCFDREDYLGCRNWCMVHLMLDAGLRSGEVVRLKWEHVKDTFVYIDNSKYNKSRSVPLPEWLLNGLRHLKELTPNESAYVFLNRYGREPVTGNAVKMLFQVLKQSTGIQRLHAHLLRHTFASSYIFYGGNMELLRVLMGHSSYDVTRNYLHIANQMLLSRYDMYQVDELYFHLLGRR